MSGHVYILASRKHGTLYTGVTADLTRRVWEHREKTCGGFTARYNVTRLVWYCEYGDFVDAIADEKRIKRRRRVWKIQMIEQLNPGWDDLYTNLA